MDEPAQGEIWWANLDLPAGRRPVLVLTRSSILSRLTNVTFATITRTMRNIPSEVNLTRMDGVEYPCAVSLDNINTATKDTLDTRIATLTDERMMEVWSAVRYAFDMPD